LNDDICEQLVYAQKGSQDWKLTVDCSHDESDLGSVSGTGEMGVDLLGLVLVQADESVQDVVAGQCVIITTFVVGEVVLHWTDWELLLEAIDLVQEENDRGLDKPSGIANGIEECEGLLHTVDGLVFEEQLIVLGDGDKEEDCGDILEAMDPLLTLRALSSNIEHAVCKISNDEGGFGDTSSLDTRSEDVLVIWHVVGLSNAVNVVEVAVEKLHVSS
jgi:hypothetical protein